MSAAITAAGMLYLWFPPIPRSLRFEQVRAGYIGSESLLLDRHGEVLHELRTNDRSRRLDWVRFQEISPALLAAVLQAEDQHFYRHHGVDWAALAGAAAGAFRSATRGASTITMQLAGLLDNRLRPAGQHRSLWQKWLQIRDARMLERNWTKEEVLEAYLNLVSFRGELQGIAAAAGGLFDKKPHGLSATESTILAALLRSPNAVTPLVAKRAEALAGTMNLGLSPDDISARVTESLSHPYVVRPQASLAPHVAQRLFREARGGSTPVPGRITCTLDRALQQFSGDTLRRQLAIVRAQNVRDGAVLVIDNRSGDVLAYVGNSGEEGSARYVDGVQALRQAGSTLKPFVYGTALDQRVLTAASLLDDSPLDLPGVGGVYRPGNYDKQFHGPVSARIALASSLNVPAVRTLNLIGVESGLKTLRNAGFTTLKTDEFYGASLALGAADVSLWELANAYRSLANQGAWDALRLKDDDPRVPARRVFSPEAAFLIANILSDRESRSQTFLLESPLSTRFWTAVKTGTSKDMRDNWCVGFSELYTVGVWVGNFSGEPMWNVSGITGAAPVWVDIMNRLHHTHSSHAPELPSGIATRIIPGSGRKEYFIRGTEDAGGEAVAAPGYRIVYPTDGTVVACDPDIPSGEQRLFFEAQPREESLGWQLDGQRLGSAGALVLWPPVPGKHKLSLVDSLGRILQTVSFEVRGIVKKV
jgi:penicillin-binding protein 1C